MIPDCMGSDPSPTSTPGLPVDELSALASLAEADRSRLAGDDAAVLPAPGGRVCISTDTAVVGVHLHPGMTPRAWGYRACACALSDLAAMASAPLGVVAAVAVPADGWALVPEISAGVEERAFEQGCHLVGGDLVRAAAAGSEAPWSITVTVVGTASGSARGAPVRRTGTRSGHAIYVTGGVGAGAAGLAAFVRGGPSEPLAAAYLRPPDRLAAGRVLAPWASAMMDLSDGLGGDLPRLLSASGCGAQVVLDSLPIDPCVAAELAALAADPVLCAAGAGDDYELLITADPAHESAMRGALARIPHHEGGPVPLTKIGTCADSELTWIHRGAVVAHVPGFAHR